MLVVFISNFAFYMIYYIVVKVWCTHTNARTHAHTHTHTHTHTHIQYTHTHTDALQVSKACAT